MSKRSAYVLLTDMQEAVEAIQEYTIQGAIKQILENEPLEGADIEPV